MRIEQTVSVAGAAQLLPGIRHTPPGAPPRAVGAPRGRLCAVPAVRSGPDLARAVTRQVLKETGHAAHHVDLLCLALGFDNGADWRLAPFRLAQSCGVSRAAVLGVQQMSNGGAAAVAHAAAQFLCEPRVEAALVVAADSFTALGPDHWGTGSAQGVALEDGAAAVLLRRGARGPLSIRSIATSGAPFVLQPAAGEDMAGPRSAGTLAVADTVRRHLDHGAAVLQAVRTAVGNALQDAGLPPGDPSIGRVMLPRLGPMLVRRLLPALPAALRPKADGVDQRSAHLGPGDLLADLAELCTTEPFHGAPVTVLVSVGVGLTATCLVVEAHNTY